MKLHLTVNTEGVVSLWDDVEGAHTAVDQGEAYVHLELTPAQVEAIHEAQDAAKIYARHPWPGHLQGD
jgi:hypothetical protein